MRRYVIVMETLRYPDERLFFMHFSLVEGLSGKWTKPIPITKFQRTACERNRAI